MSAAPVLKAESLRVGYGGKPVLLDVSIELRPNEVLCVIGHNGAGKSTLMRTLFGLVKHRPAACWSTATCCRGTCRACWPPRVSP